MHINRVLSNFFLNIRLCIIIHIIGNFDSIIDFEIKLHNESY